MIRKTRTPKTDDVANEIKKKAWNDHIVPRLESMRAWLSDSAWTDGLAPYLRESESALIATLIQGNSQLTHEQERFLAGQIAAWKQLLSLPEAILNNIIAMDRNKAEAEKRAKAVGTAGY